MLSSIHYFGVLVGFLDGLFVGFFVVGLTVVGLNVGLAVVGAVVGFFVVGLAVVGLNVGLAVVGAVVGLAVGHDPSPFQNRHCSSVAMVSSRSAASPHRRFTWTLTRTPGVNPAS